jgi:peptidoglycan/LPS O-acetylase OafA/YrhL
MLKTTFKNYKRIFFGILLVGFLLLSLFPGIIYINNSEIKNINIESDIEPCIYSSRELLNSTNNELNVYVKNYDVSIYPEIRNINCIGKIFSFSLSENELIIFNVTSSKLIKFLTNLHLAVFILLSVFRRTKLIEVVFSIFFYWLLYRNYLITSLSSITILLYIIIYFLRTSSIIDFKHKENIFKGIKKVEYSNALNSLRGISVVAVFLYHANKSILPGGYLGVDIFIFISGFLISNVIISQLNSGTFTLRGFYQRRIKRLFPALFFTIFVSGVFSIFILDSTQYQLLIESSLASIFFVSNYYFKNINFYTSESMELLPLLHTWSLSLEEQFYLVFPLLLVLVFKLKYKFFFIGSLFISSIYLNILFENNTDLFYLLQYRFWEFLFGFFTMILYSKKIMLHKYYSYIGYLLMAACFLFFSEIYILSIIPKLLLAISFLFIALSSYSDIKKGTFYLLGASSYSFYLFHQPIISIYRRIFEKSLLGILEGFILFFIVLTLAIISYFYIEKFFLETSSNFANLSLIISLLSVCIFLIIQFYFGLSKLSSDENLIFYESIVLVPSSDSKQRCETNSDMVESYEDVSDICDLNSITQKHIIIVGDSHAINVSRVLDNYLETETKIINLTGGSGKCLLFGKAFYENTPCKEAFFESLLNIIDDNSTIIVSARIPYWLEESRFNILEGTAQSTSNIPIETLLKTRLNLISEKSKITILIYPIPSLDESISSILPNPTEDIKSEVITRIPEWKKDSLQSNIILSSINSNSVVRIFPQNILCEDSKNFKHGLDCSIVKDSEYLYYDDNHLSVYGNYLILGEVLQIINNE